MNGQKVLGIIFSNLHDEVLNQLTDLRTMGSVPFCSRYRLIDFPLSAMVGSGMTKVGIVTKANYASLMDHIGTGKPWDLARKYDGLYLLPPFSGTGVSTRLDALYNNRNFIRHSRQDYILMTDCNMVTSLDYNELFDYQEKVDADMVIVASKGKMPSNLENILVFDKVDKNGKVVEASLDPVTTDDVLYSNNIILVKKYILENLVTKAYTHNQHHFQKDVIMSNMSTLKLNVFTPKNTYSQAIDSLQSYFKINMEMLDSKNREKMFNQQPIFTKERDDMPARYGVDANMKNSLVADGCAVDGTVENSILFRGVTVAKDAVVKNSIIMQDTVVGEGARLNCVITDKNVIIKHGVELKGAPSYPICLGKNATI